VGSTIINKNEVPSYSEIINETAFTGHAWKRQRKQPPWAQKSSKKTESLPTQIINKVFPQLTHGFNSTNMPS
jgi:hypothetical protein